MARPGKSAARSSRGSARELADAEARLDLIAKLVGLIDRTFATSGHGEGLQMVRAMLARLDAPTLREVTRSLGIDAPEELDERARGETG